MRNLNDLLRDVTDFAQLDALTTAQRILGLAEVAAGAVEQLNRNLQEAGDVLSADDMAELKPLMERIVPRAIETGRHLDEKLEQAKRS